LQEKKGKYYVILLHELLRVVKIIQSICIKIDQAWWYTPVIPELRRLRQVDGKFAASLSYTVRPCLKKNDGCQGPGELLFNGERQDEKSFLESSVPVAHTYNPSYLGGYQQSHSSRPVQANSAQDLIAKVTREK
jgi:hypothetical protein